ncbi:hypothetical protein ACHHYP_05520 [Achlya hypogyna]|uniref:Malonyl-CoA:ACP transacylase (MAT) domain-containing protein n=1 Tax=Achlya hypogyna TaxID=1202772 RepID=A0A1V9YXI4_ACHHY|nr:hypothetical protein ACHHYP_05520 [Achlya hypogyna]
MAATTYFLFPLAGDNLEELRAAACYITQDLLKHATDVDCLPALYRELTSASTFRGYRAIVRASTPRQLLEGLRAIQDNTPLDDVVFLSTSAAPSSPARVIYIFNGMGTQWNGMGAELYQSLPAFRDTIEKAEGVFEVIGGRRSIVATMMDTTSCSMSFNGSGQAGNFLLQVGLLGLLSSRLVSPPVGAIGLSAGEPAAAYCAGSLSLSDAATVVHARLTMQERVSGQPSGMLAVLAGESTVRPFLGEDVEIAGILAPTLITVTGLTPALQAFTRALPPGITTIDVPMKAAYHSKIMESAGIPADLVAALEGISPTTPQRHLISTVTGDFVTGPDQNGVYWWQNVRQPVRFQEALTKALSVADVFVELGPHPSVARSIAATAAATHSAVRSLATMQRGINELLAIDRVVANLFLSGHDIPLLAILSAAAVAREAPRKQVLPVVLIPGLASSQLHAWKNERCHGSIGHEVRIGDRMWIDVGRLLSQPDCWERCMKLHVRNQSDVACKLRAGDGISAITELAPGLVTGPLSVVWRHVIETLTDHFDMGPHQLMVAAYDWRLPPSMLQERDHFFYTMLKRIEDAVHLHQSRGVVVIAHSLGNNVLRYFLAWARRNIHTSDKEHEGWVRRHIAAYFALGSPFLGSSEPLECLVTGLSVKIPLSLDTYRRLQTSHGSTQWILPFPRTLQDDPTDAHANAVFASASTAVRRNFTLRELTNGSFHRAMGERDPTFVDLEYVRQRYYAEDPVLNVHTPWPRPPIESIYVRHRYAYSERERGAWTLDTLFTETPDPATCNKTGDGTVSYYSLSWGHSWLGADGATVKMTRAPQAPYFSHQDIAQTRAVRLRYAEYEGGLQCKTGPQLTASVETQEMQKHYNSGFLGDLWNSQLDEPKIHFFEHIGASDAGNPLYTSVWEFDLIKHREMLSEPAFLRELKFELHNVFEGKAHTDKAFRPPSHDADCYWNYRQARCEFGDYCQYDYKFGDVTLDQSCRVKTPVRLAPHVAFVLPTTPEQCHANYNLILGVHDKCLDDSRAG